ncbi:hypothetical protein VIGAN_03022800 [Vigna angularis var. angularis]|uniref:Uncharacterized protein n=1 Tax=Vigna angularis var. angularis TaxID=157739 RepID=A0A0S3RJ93_PHAAN|nr:hypothetical protein VIGAN_03022800 [Vigna angularis var. angularis]
MKGRLPCVPRNRPPRHHLPYLPSPFEIGNPREGFVPSAGSRTQAAASWRPSPLLPATTARTLPLLPDRPPLVPPEPSSARAESASAFSDPSLCHADAALDEAIHREP